jgi:hypothetical protein
MLECEQLCYHEICVVLSNVCVLFHCSILLSMVYRVCQNQHYIELIYLFSAMHWILLLALFLYYFIILMFGCGTYTLLHIDDIIQIREVEDVNYIGIYPSVRKCKTPTYKLILKCAHMYANCSSRGWRVTHYIVVLFHFEVFCSFGTLK